jgi:hypothetical protein
MKVEKWENKPPELACIYAYYEKNAEYKENLLYFLENGILDHVDYYFVMNGDYSVSVPNRSNVHIIERPNIGYDFGAWSHALAKISFSRYSHVFFMNTSVRGPFMKDGSRNWTKPFLDLFRDDVKLVGTTINIMDLPSIGIGVRKHVPCVGAVCPHVQSMFFVLDREALAFLLSKNFFDEDEMTKLDFNQVVGKKEVGMSYHILQNKWNIASILPEYQHVDYRTVKKDINGTSHYGDSYYENMYFGRTLHPYEVIFFKTNRLPLPKDM